MNRDFERADDLGGHIIGAAVEAHRRLGPELPESLQEERLVRELELRSPSAVRQFVVG